MSKEEFKAMVKEFREEARDSVTYLAGRTAVARQYDPELARLCETASAACAAIANHIDRRQSHG